VRGVALHTPNDSRLSAGIVTFEVAGKSPHRVVEELGKRRIIASTTPYSKSFARLTPGILNSEQEVETAVNEVVKIASAKL
jgi:selenocysteine lyase/cysteine desulfurase